MNLNLCSHSVSAATMHPKLFPFQRFDVVDIFQHWNSKVLLNVYYTAQIVTDCSRLRFIYQCLSICLSILAAMERPPQ